MPRVSHPRDRGFSMPELVLVLGVLGVLAAIALPVYTRYLERAELAQLLVQIDQISTAVQTEDATGIKALHQDAQPGRAPPALRTVPDEAFREPGGLRLLLIRAPAGFFATSPGTEQYGLLADLTGAATPQRLRELNRALPFTPGDKIWLSQGQLAFPLVARALAATAPPAGPATSWQGQGERNPSGSWDCVATVGVYGTDNRLLTAVDAGVQVRVTLEGTNWAGQPISRGWDDSGRLQDGKATFRVRNLAGPGKGEVITTCRLAVTGVTYWWPPDPPVKWDGTKASIAIGMPAKP